MATQATNPDIDSARFALVKQAYGRFVRQLSVLAQEIAMESGPYREAADSLATSADRIHGNIVRMLDAARLLSDVGDPVDPALLELRQLSNRMQQEVIVPLRKAAALDESAARTAFRGLGQSVSSTLQDCESRMTNAIVASVDVARYSSLASWRQENAGVEGVIALNEEIEELVKDSLRKIGISTDESLVEMTSDGAILAFKSPLQAHKFSAALHYLAQTSNSAKDMESQLHFRIGVSAGQVETEEPIGLSGTIAEAIRLEAASRNGEALMSEAAWEKLPKRVQRLYGSTESIAGKRRERMAARRCRFVPMDLIQIEE